MDFSRCDFFDLRRILSVTDEYRFAGEEDRAVAATARPVRANKGDIDALHTLAQLLDSSEQQEEPGGSEPIAVTGAAGEAIAMPDAVRVVLARAVHALLQGDAVSVMSIHTEMTTQEAADYLAVSRPYLISLLDAGEIPYTRLKSHRRLRLGDVEAYRARLHAERMTVLDELTREIDAAGLYTMDGLEKADE